VSARGQGWAITIHWALPYLKDLLSPETLAGIDEVQVDPEIGRKDTGNFLFINLSNCETKYRIPPSERRRVNREKLRAVLLRDVASEVHWSKSVSIVESTDNGVKVTFDDGTSTRGSLVVGADGANSRVRRFLRPDDYRNSQLPIRFLGSAVDMTPAQVAPLRKLDPLLFQGCHPESSCFMWVSMLETPAFNGTAENEPDKQRYRVQLNLSWPVRSPADEPAPTDQERVADMKRRAGIFAPVLRDAIHAIPDDAEVLEIKLADWPCLDWDNSKGRITLVGDAAVSLRYIETGGLDSAVL
jgi:2-polyprenyl-6-methoxyphenol hydroxylase-like FAD-dependent oxidoreductase